MKDDCFTEFCCFLSNLNIHVKVFSSRKFLAMLHSRQDLSSPARDWICIPHRGSVESWPLDCQGAALSWPLLSVQFSSSYVYSHCGRISRTFAYWKIEIVSIKQECPISTLPTSPSDHHSTSCFYECFGYSRHFMWVKAHSIHFLWLIYFG